MIWWLNGLSSLIRRLLMGTLLSVLLLLFLLPELDLFSVDFFSEWAVVTAVVFIGGIFSFKRNFIVTWFVMAATILVMMTKITNQKTSYVP